MGNEFFICVCNSPEHQMIVSKDLNGDKEIYVRIHLKHRKFLKRLISGIKYILGYKCRYGNFEEFILSPSDYKRLKSLLDDSNEKDESLLHS